MQPIKNRFRELLYSLSGNGGFSMVELIVAVALSSIIMIMIYSSNSIILNSIKNYSKVSEFYREYNLAYYRIDKDISSVFFNTGNENLVFKGSSDDGVRSNSEISFVTVAKNDLYMNYSSDELTMDSDVKLVEYYLKKDPSFPDLNFLIRKEFILYNEISEDFEEQKVKNFSEESILLKNVKDLKFEFYSGRMEKNWDLSVLKRLPQTVKTTIIINDYSGGEHTFSFISKPGINQ
ncbi:MAG: prepilin-type N-terminal cleavage/methylation domain-containing protein [Spirochaetes bacterium]|nr:prepilin-type N-terminal cleavage/methylation domain-containing protein [Spirochaetota bacterium]